jgi:hypothetical protein
MSLQASLANIIHDLEAIRAATQGSGPTAKSIANIIQDLEIIRTATGRNGSKGFRKQDLE